MLGGLIVATVHLPPGHAAAPEPPKSSEAPAKVSGKIAKILAKGDGKSRETAYKVRDVAQEYAILEALTLKPVSQSLMVDKKAYDVITVQDAAGRQFDIWFEVPFGL